MRMKFLIAVALIGSALSVPSYSRADGLQIFGTESPPINFTEDGKYAGMVVDVVNELRKSTGTAAEIVVVPTARATQYAVTKSNILVFTYGKTPEREQAGFHFLGPMVTRDHALWKKRVVALNIGNVAEIKSQNLTVGAELGDWRSKFFKDAGVSVENVATNDLNLKKLVANHIPLMVSSNFEMPLAAKLEGVDFNSLEVAYTFSVSSSYLMFSKDTDQIVLDQWQNAYIDLQKTDFLAKTAEKWGKILGADLKFAPDKGFYIP